MKKKRVGRYVTQPTGYKAYIPEPLPPEPPIKSESKLRNLLSEADSLLARLDGITTKQMSWAGSGIMKLMNLLKN